MAAVGKPPSGPLSPGPGKIRCLPDHVVTRIAAGEVIERPASVVRELVDNSLDAGGTSIVVEVVEGGRGLIRVTDDGEGMGRADALLAFHRHATSKLRSEDDLWSIATLGFRGEALPSIASVSRVSLRTAMRSEPVGTRLELEGGDVRKTEEAAAAPGTQIEIRDLFFNVPARRKFLKSPATEFSHICQAAQQAALAWPAVHVRLIHNGQDVFDYPAAASRRDRLLQVYGARWMGQVAVVEAERPGLRLAGVIVQGPHAKAGRTPQEWFVNKRAIRNATLAHAVQEGYSSFLAKGRLPQYVLFLDVDPARVDVNVHPAKREVRFADQEAVHQLVRQAVRTALGGSAWDGTKAGATPVSSGPPPFSPGSRPAAGDLTGSVELFREQATAWSRAASQLDLPGQPGDRAESAVREPAASYGTADAEPAGSVGMPPDVRPMGQIAYTFLVAQVGTELQIVDQHTAHERVLFERLWRAWHGKTVASQPLLIPETIDLPPHATALLGRHLADLEQLGLSLEPFGGSSVLVRAVPAVLGQMDYGALVHDLLDDLQAWNSAATLEARIKPVLASLACHSAVRAGRSMSLPESQRLIEEWVAEGMPMTCPHGRRVAVRMPEAELAKMFGRA